MIKNKLYLCSIFSALIIAVSGCKSNSEQPVVQENQIQKYLTNEAFYSSTQLDRIEKNLSFWKEKLKSDTPSVTYRLKLGSAYESRFEVTKDIRDLNRADSLYSDAYERPHGKNVETLQALADLSITKHHFKQAYSFSNAALKIGDQKRSSLMLTFDAMMERGDYKLARQDLDRTANTHNFGFLIRLSKYKDYEGKLDSAIHYMEEAEELGKHSPKLIAWSKSNLGDMYGHDNQVRKSYSNYLQVLAMENTGGSFIHSLKGIAWIAFAHDRNTELALEILHFVDEQIQSPDVKLRLAEIAEYEGREDQKENYQQAFINEAQKPEYYGMYDAQLIELAASEIDSTEWAMDLINKELSNRPSPQIHDLNAWTYYHRGNAKKALQIIREHVEGKTFEPMAVYHMAKIYSANGLVDKARMYLKEAFDAGYELGPIITADIKKELKNIETSNKGMTSSVQFTS